jgi:extracellular matrix regulatory protein A
LTVELVHVGFGSILAANRILAIISPESAPVRRMISQAREAGTLIDSTYGRKTKAVVILDTGHLVTVALQPDTIANRIEQQRGE